MEFMLFLLTAIGAITAILYFYYLPKSLPFKPLWMATSNGHLIAWIIMIVGLVAFFKLN